MVVSKGVTTSHHGLKLRAWVITRAYSVCVARREDDPKGGAALCPECTVLLKQELREGGLQGVPAPYSARHIVVVLEALGPRMP